MGVCFGCCVLSGRGLCDGLITRQEESYRLWRVVVYDHETSNNEEAKARYRAVENRNTLGCNARKTNKQQHILCVDIIKIVTVKMGSSDPSSISFLWFLY